MQIGIGIGVGRRRRSGANPRSIVQVLVGTLAGNDLPVTVDATGTGGTLYLVLQPEGMTAPTPTRVRNGQNGLGGAPTFAGNGAATGSIVLDLPDGIPLANYVLYAIIDNGALSPTVGASAPFSLSTAAPALARTRLSSATTGNTATNSATLNLSAAPSGAVIYLGFASNTGSGQANNTISQISVQGQVVTSAQGFVTRSPSTTHGNIVEIWKVTLSSAGQAAAAIALTRTGTAQTFAVWAYHIEGTITNEVVASGLITGSSATIPVNVQTGVGGVVLGFSTFGEVIAPTWSGITLDETLTALSGRFVSAASVPTTAAENPRSIVCDPSPSSALAANGGAAVVSLW